MAVYAERLVNNGQGTARPFYAGSVCVVWRGVSVCRVCAAAGIAVAARGLESGAAGRTRTTLGLAGTHSWLARRRKVDEQIGGIASGGGRSEGAPRRPGSIPSAAYPAGRVLFFSVGCGFLLKKNLLVYWLQATCLLVWKT